MYSFYEQACFFLTLLNTICYETSDYLDIYSIKNGLYDKPSIKLLLKDDGFIFP